MMRTGAAQIIGDAYQQPGWREVSFRVHVPDREGDDWNDVLRVPGGGRDRSTHSFPAGRLQVGLPKGAGPCENDLSVR
jgi:hypothetical protein